MKTEWQLRLDLAEVARELSEKIYIAYNSKILTPYEAEEDYRSMIKEQKTMLNLINKIEVAKDEEYKFSK